MRRNNEEKVSKGQCQKGYPENGREVMDGRKDTKEISQGDDRHYLSEISVWISKRVRKNGPGG